jgi:hypothetical protein
MSFFVTRVELHDVPANQSRETYEKLHAAMAAKGFARVVTHNGHSLTLPPAEYGINSDSDVGAVNTSAVAAARTVVPKFETMTNQSSTFAEYNLKKG